MKKTRRHEKFETPRNSSPRAARLLLSQHFWWNNDERSLQAGLPTDTPRAPTVGACRASAAKRRPLHRRERTRSARARRLVRQRESVEALRRDLPSVSLRVGPKGPRGRAAISKATTVALPSRGAKPTVQPTPGAYSRANAQSSSKRGSLLAEDSGGRP